MEGILPRLTRILELFSCFLSRLSFLDVLEDDGVAMSFGQPVVVQDVTVLVLVPVVAELALPVLKGNIEVYDYAFQFKISIIAPESELSSLDIGLSDDACLVLEAGLDVGLQVATCQVLGASCQILDGGSTVKSAGGGLPRKTFV